MQKTVPGYITYFNFTPPGGEPTLQVAIYYPVSAVKTYLLQYTSDGATWVDAYTFSPVPGQKNHSVGVTPVPGALWPRLIEKT